MIEEEYFNAWRAMLNGKPSRDSASLAISAGHLCTKTEPAFIFIAGYQAAIRATFKEVVSDQWLAFAASEDRNTNNRKPGVTIVDNHLYGFKTWIAASKFVGELIIKVGSGPDSRYVRASVTAPGVILTHKPAARFLPELSQAQAELNGVVFTELQDLSLIQSFTDCEPYYIYLALLSSLSTMKTMHGEPSNLATRANRILQTHKGTIDDLAKLDRAVQSLLESPDPDLKKMLSNWRDDAKLFSMYSNGIQRRHGG